MLVFTCCSAVCLQVFNHDGNGAVFFFFSLFFFGGGGGVHYIYIYFFYLFFCGCLICADFFYLQDERKCYGDLNSVF